MTDIAEPKVEVFYRDQALAELEVIQATISVGTSVPWAMPKDFGNKRSYRIAGITPVLEDPSFTELIVALPGRGNTHVRLGPLPNYGLYDHEDLVVTRFEADGKTWWELNEGSDDGYFVLLVFFLPEGVAPQPSFDPQALV